MFHTDWLKLKLWEKTLTKAVIVFLELTWIIAAFERKNLINKGQITLG